MTPTQDRLFSFLLERVGDRVQPSIAEMAEHLGLSGRGAVHRTLQQLLKIGRVEKLPQAERCWRAVPIERFEGISDRELLDELARRGWHVQEAETCVVLTPGARGPA